MPTLSLTGLVAIKRFEALRLNAYQDSRGIWTIGYGHTASVHQGDTVTEDQATAMLLADTAKVARRVSMLVTVPVTPNQFDALVSLVFNIGVGAFSRSRLLQKINAGELLGAAEEFDRWVYAGGEVSAGLRARRASEKAMFLMEGENDDGT